MTREFDIEDLSSACYCADLAMESENPRRTGAGCPSPQRRSYPKTSNAGSYSPSSSLNLSCNPKGPLEPAHLPSGEVLRSRSIPSHPNSCNPTRAEWAGPWTLSDFLVFGLRVRPTPTPPWVHNLTAKLFVRAFTCPNTSLISNL